MPQVRTLRPTCFTKTSRGIEHRRSVGEGKVFWLLPRRKTVVHVRQIYAAEVRYFPPSDAAVRNWNIVFHNICAVLTVSKENTYFVSAHSVEHIMFIITKPTTCKYKACKHTCDIPSYLFRRSIAILREWHLNCT